LSLDTGRRGKWMRHFAIAPQPHRIVPCVGRTIYDSLSGMRTQSSENGYGEQALDPVAEILHDFRLSGGYYCRSELRAPWGLEIPGRCGAGFNFVVEGNCYLRWGSGEPLRLDGGDLVLLPRGGGLILSDSPDGAAVPADSLAKEIIGQNAALLRYGGDGEL